MCKFKDKLIKESEREIKGQTTRKEADEAIKKLGLQPIKTKSNE